MSQGPRLLAAPGAMVRYLASAARRHRHLKLALADQAMVSACNFLTLIVLARYLGLAEFGRYTLAWTVILISSSLHVTVVVSPMTSIAPKQRAEDQASYYGAVLMQHAAVAVFGFILIAGGALVSDSIFPSWQAARLALPLAAIFLAESSHVLLRRYFFTSGLIAWAFITDAIRNVGQLVALVVFVQFARLDVITALWIMFAGAASGVGFCLWRVERLRWERAVFRTVTVRHWHFSKWLTLGTIMNWTSSNAFIVAAGALLGTSAVGAVRATQALLGPVHVVLLGLENIAPIRAARAYHEVGVAAMKRYLGRVAIFLGAATAGVGIVAAAVPAFWLNLAFGAEYAEFGYLVRWWAVIYLLSALSMPIRAGLSAIERTRGVFVASLLTSGFAFVFAYGMVSRFEILGIVGGSVIMGLMRNSTLALSLLRWLRVLRKAETDSLKAP